MNQAPLRAAVIGVGSMGRHHARVYTELAQTQLVGVSDVSAETGQRIASLYNVPAFQDYRELLDEVQPDIVSVVVPTKYHREVASYVM